MAGGLHAQPERSRVRADWTHASSPSVAGFNRHSRQAPRAKPNHRSQVAIHHPLDLEAIG
jgi:hypothetical protein